jgi:hypothetical protein
MRENQPPAKAIEWVSDRIAQRDASEPATSPARTRRPTSHKPTTSRHFSELLAVLAALRSPSDAIEERGASRRYCRRIRIGSIVFRVDDLPGQLAFWTEALDYVPREAPEDDWAVLRPRSGRGPNISLSAKPSQVQQGPRIHLDLYSEDQAGDIERLLALGATRPHEPNRPANADYVILADPEGNRFCVVGAG